MQKTFTGGRKGHFDQRWETIYAESKGKHLNKYPFGELVSVFFRNLSHLRTSIEKTEEIKVLELGCGAGNNLVVPLSEGMSAFGIDGSRTAISISREKYLKTENKPGLCVSDFCFLPFIDCTFDIVIDRESVCSNTLRAIDLIFSEVERVLKPGGLYLSFMYSHKDGHRLQALCDKKYAIEIEPNTFSNFQKGTFKDTGKIHFFSQQEIVRLCENRFEVISLSLSVLDQIIPEIQNQRSEFILVGRK